MASHKWNAGIGVAVSLIAILSVVPTSMAKTWYFDWEVTIVNVTRNCYTKPLMAVNGLYPGPTIDVYEGDQVIVKVYNGGNHNITIHWHGIRQFRSCWADGVGYITECPIQPGNYEVYDFFVVGQSGTTFWHAHVNWMRATVHGSFVTRPKNDEYVYPYYGDGEFPVLLGEWWNEDADLIEQQILAAGSAFPLADATTLNGYPGTYYNCSDTEGITTFDVQSGKTYLLRIVNVALNTEYFFAIANHTLTVVEADSNCVKPFTTSYIVISPGQTLNVLFTANQAPGSFFIVGQPYSSLLVTDPAAIPAPALPFVLQDVPYISTNGLVQYTDAPLRAPATTFFPTLPAVNDTTSVDSFLANLKTVYPEKVPTSNHIRHLFYTVGTGTEPCTPEAPCSPQQGPYRVVGQVSNISWVIPEIAILVAYWYKVPGVYVPNFPDKFPDPNYDYTQAASPPDASQVSQKATRLAILEHNQVVELVLQDMNNFAYESHPFHLHGHFFSVLGRGDGNYNSTTSPATFNYYDPPVRFTVDVPARGWAAIRFLADNPGAWLLHCHFEKHLSWGMNTVFIVKDGNLANQKLPPPPKRINPCIA